jgi:MarR family transcriptional regulator, organic hydroperoxide resistance regulator
MARMSQDARSAHDTHHLDDIPQWPTGRLLSAAARRVEREWNAHLSAWDLNHASLPVMALLARSDHSQRELAAVVGVTEQTMSRMLDRMERIGHVSRTTHRTDRRRHVISLTVAGHRVLLEAADPAPAERMTTRGLTGDQVAQLRELLALVVRAGQPTADDEAPPTAS